MKIFLCTDKILDNPPILIVNPQVRAKMPPFFAYRYCLPYSRRSAQHKKYLGSRQENDEPGDNLLVNTCNMPYEEGGTTKKRG
jgi:hypothetical protein